jgi:hypothetical protein
MTDQERLEKNAFCDFLMKQGLDGLSDAEAVDRASVLATFAIELGRKDGVALSLIWHETLEKKGIVGEPAIVLDLSWANAIAGERYGTTWQWEQPTLAREIYHLRRAVSHAEFAQSNEILRCKGLNNLGNRLRVAGRVIEALDCWRRAVEVQPNFGMALCNRARFFVDYGQALEDNDAKALFLWVAHKEASAALAPTALYTDARDETTKAAIKTLKEWIESFVDVNGIAALDPLAEKHTTSTKEERDYRHWCLINCLYLDPFNDLGSYSVAASDSQGSQFMLSKSIHPTSSRAFSTR